MIYFLFFYLIMFAAKFPRFGVSTISYELWVFAVLVLSETSAARFTRCYHSSGTRREVSEHLMLRWRNKSVYENSQKVGQET